ncbi:MAG TPA: ribbon-helix-helix domain-containing protein, partial [Dongiaceae bacterium]|nr:ribbon-helix-helix domain-containing protein [Dongiaceae bacterium]
MRHRIIQFKGRRFSVKLDDVVWRSLEELAAEAGLRLNRLVAQVARDAAGAGVTAALRRFCLEQALARAKRL